MRASRIALEVLAESSLLFIKFELTLLKLLK